MPNWISFFLFINRVENGTDGPARLVKLKKRRLSEFPLHSLFPASLISEMKTQILLLESAK